MVISVIDCCKTKWNKEKISFQKINKIDYESFHSDILNSDLIKKPETDLSALCQQCDSVLSFILDKDAHANAKTLPRKPPTPWMSPEIMKAKTSRCKHQCHLCNKMMTKAKSKYFSWCYNARSQRVQNCLARVVTMQAPRFSRFVPILIRLHWLAVKFRIRFKICAITFRTLKDNQPAYLADLLVRPKCSKYLRSTNSNEFVVPRIKN